jgi:hypothetical protein
MKYCLDSTRSHPLSIRFPRYLKEINTIVRDEGGDEQLFDTEVALNLDKVKENSENPDVKKLKSMDMIVAVRPTLTEEPSSLMVDFKLECRGTKGLKDGHCRDKIRHSKLLLFGSGVPVHNRFVFIFNNNLIQESRSVLSRVLNNPSTDVLSLNEFKTIYF